MKRRNRFLLHVALPPFFGALLIALVVFALEHPKHGFLLTLLYFLPAAYVFMGLQSLAYAALMGLAVARGLVPGSAAAIGVSAMLGFLAGATMGKLGFMLVGLGVGIVVALLDRHLERRARLRVAPAL